MWVSLTACGKPSCAFDDEALHPRLADPVVAPPGFTATYNLPSLLVGLLERHGIAPPPSVPRPPGTPQPPAARASSQPPSPHTPAPLPRALGRAAGSAASFAEVAEATSACDALVAAITATCSLAELRLAASSLAPAGDTGCSALAAQLAASACASASTAAEVAALALTVRYQVLMGGGTGVD